MIKRTETLEEFLELNQDYITDLAQQQLYQEAGHLDDYDVGSIEVNEPTFNSVGTELYYGILEYPQFYLSKMVNRPEHFYDMTISELPDVLLKHTNKDLFNKLLQVRERDVLLFKI